MNVDKYRHTIIQYSIRYLLWNLLQEKRRQQFLMYRSGQ